MTDKTLDKYNQAIAKHEQAIAKLKTEIVKELDKSEHGLEKWQEIIRIGEYIKLTSNIPNLTNIERYNMVKKEFLNTIQRIDVQ